MNNFSIALISDESEGREKELRMHGISRKRVAAVIFVFQGLNAVLPLSSVAKNSAYPL